MNSDAISKATHSAMDRTAPQAAVGVVASDVGAVVATIVVSLFRRENKLGAGLQSD
ncbi:hypothetical protein D3C86_1472620 [compost metagenome]